ncbi:MAG: DUF996 domain-containing protein [Candidatus Hodarchaeota archaeon]
MGTLAQAKTLGGVGSILILLSIVPSAGVVLGVVGFILVLIAVKYVSESLGDKSIFNNMLIAVILAIVGVVVGAVVVFASIFKFIGLSNLSGQFMGSEFFPSTIPSGDIIGFIASVVVGLVVIWICYLISAVFLRKSYNSIAAKLNIGIFKTTALLYLIGAALSIVVVGFIIIFIAEILQIVAFFSIPEKQTQPQQQNQPT